MIAKGLLTGWTLVLTLAAGLMLAPAHAEEGVMAAVTVTVRPRSEVGVHPITVGDLAAVAGANPELCKAIADLDVADSIGTHNALPVSRSQIAFRIQLAGLPEGLVHVEGAERAEAAPAWHQVTEADV